MPRSRLAFAFALLALLGCGESVEPDPDGGLPGCPTHEGAGFELGTGETTFEPIAAEQRLAITPGPQQGCHFFLAIRTDGFAERRLRVQYEVFRADNGESTDSSSVFTLRLKASSEYPGQCEAVGITAFLIQPWTFANERVRLKVDVTDDEGRAASQRQTVIADWPSSLSDDGCGPRT